MAAIVIYGVIFSYFTLLKHNAFNSYAWDLGIFAQAFHTTLYDGRLFYYTPELWFNPSGCFFAVHFSPILFLLMPIYAVRPTAETLLVAQSFLLALAAIPLYMLSTALLKSKKAGFVFVLAYLLYSPLHGANWFDFHPQAFIPILLFSTYYFMARESWKLHLVTALLTLTIQEHLVYIVSLIALYNLLLRSDLKKMASSIRNLRKTASSLMHLNRISASVIVLVMCIGWYYITRIIKGVYPITPDFLDTYRAVDTLRVLDFTGNIALLPIHVIMNPQNALSALTYDFPIKFLYTVILFGPLLFLSFRSRSVLISLVVLIPMLLTNYRAYYTIGAQYPLYLIPLVFISAIEGLSAIRSRQPSIHTPSIAPIRDVELNGLLKNIIIISMIFVVSTSPLSPFAYTFSESGLFWYPPPVHLQQKSFVEPLHQLVSMVPSNASILTQNNIFPHFASRINAYVVPFGLPSFQKEERKREIVQDHVMRIINDSQYVLLDLRWPDYWTAFVRDRILQGPFRIYAIAQSYTLFSRDYNGEPVFVPDLNYEVFPVYRDLVHSGEVVYDGSSNSGFVVFSGKDVNNGTFVYGPYVCLPPGVFNVTFEIKIGEYTQGHVASFEVIDEFGSVRLAKSSLSSHDIKNEGWNNLTLTVSSDTFRSHVEFRITTSGLADLYVDRVIVEKSDHMPSMNYDVFLAYADLVHSGEVVYDGSSNSGFVVFSGKDVNNGTFVYGPYVCLPPGVFNVTFEIKIGECDDGYIGKVDVSENSGRNVQSKLDLYGFLVEPNKWFNVTLSINSAEYVEFRVFSSGRADMYLDRVILQNASTTKVNFNARTFNFRELSLINGFLSEEGFFVNQHNITEGFFWYGPYISMPSGVYAATFYLKILPTAQHQEQEALVLSISANNGREILSELVVDASILNDGQAPTWREVTLVFASESRLENVEFRGMNPSRDYDIYFAFAIIQELS
jgi:uncharacterized membrane protein